MNELKQRINARQLEEDDPFTNKLTAKLTIF